MKKLISWMLTLALIVALLPALPVAAAGDAYYVLGIEDGDRVILNPQVDGYSTFQHKVMVVDANQITLNASGENSLSNGHTITSFKLNPAATGISQVAFDLDGTVTVDTTYPYEFPLTGDYVGTHTLTVTTTPVSGTPQVNVINFTGIVGDVAEDVKTNYASLTDANMPFKGSRANAAFTHDAEGGRLKIGYTTVNTANPDDSVWLKADSANPMPLGDTKMVYIDFDYQRVGGFSMQLNAEDYRAGSAIATGTMHYSKPDSDISTVTSMHITLAVDYSTGIMNAYANGVLFNHNIPTDAVKAALTSATGASFRMKFYEFSDGDALYVDNFNIRSYDAVEAAAITGASLEDGAVGVSERLSTIRLTAERNIGTPAVGDVTITEIDPETGAETPFTAYNVSASGNEFIIQPTSYLALGKTYRVTADKVKDIYGLRFNPYEFSFTTRGENDNLKPVVTAPSLAARYDYGEAITLSVTAVDELATADRDAGVTYVEFLKDGEVISGSRKMAPDEGTEDTYTFLWTNAPERLAPYRITVRACDTNDETTESEPVSVMVYSPRAPELTMTAPESINGKIGGEAGDNLTVSASATDEDGVITSAVFELYDPNGDLVETKEITSGFEAMDVVFTGDLATAGLYTVNAVVYDDNDAYKGDGEALSAASAASVQVSHLAKSYPAFITEDLTDQANKAKWALTGSATKILDENGVTVTQSVAGDVKIARTHLQSMMTAPWMADLTVSFADSAHKRIVSFEGIANELFTFDETGAILFGTTNVGTYEGERDYKISLIANPATETSVVLLNSTMVGTIATPMAKLSSVIISITQTGSGAETWFNISDYSVYQMTNGVSPDDLGVTIGLFHGQIELDAATLPQRVEYISIASAAELDAETVEKGILLLAPDGSLCKTTYTDGKLYINEKLKAGSTYTLRLTLDLCNAAGVGLASTKDFALTTAPKAVSIAEAATAFADEALPEVAGTITFNTTLSGVATVVCAVYEGNLLKGIVKAENASGAVAVPVDLTTIYGADGAVPANAFVEAFVVDSLTTMNPVSDTIYRLD